MTTFAKPTDLPRWAETAGGVPDANIVDPPSGTKDTGWTVGVAPPSSYENWRSNLTYNWLAHYSERFFDLNAVGGADQQSLRIAVPTGDISIVSGTAASEGGDILIECGGTTGTGTGADIDINAGMASGTDQAGGLVTIRSGQGTGTEGGLIFFQASTGATTGSSANALENYFVINGNNENNELRKPLFTNTTGAVIDIQPGAHSNTSTIGGHSYNWNIGTQSTSGRTGYLYDVANDSVSDSTDDAAFASIFPFNDSANNDSPEWRAFKHSSGVAATERFWVSMRGAGYFEGDLGIGVAPTGTPPTGAARLHVDRDGGSLPAISGDTVAVFSKTANTTDVSRVLILGGDTGDGRVSFGDTADGEIGYMRFRNGLEEFRWNISGNDNLILAPNTLQFESTLTSATDTFRVQDADNTLGRLAMRVTGNAGATELFAVDSTGPVGVGTASPTNPFEVHSGGSSMTFDPDLAGLHQYTYTGGSQIRFSAASGQYFHFLTGSASFRFDENLSDPEFSLGATNASFSLVSVSTRFDPPGASTTGDLISSSAGFPIGINLRNNNADESFYVAFDSTDSSADADTAAFLVKGGGVTGGVVGFAGRMSAGALTDIPATDSVIHINDDDTGATSFAGAQLIVENDTESRICLMTGNSRNAVVVFGDPDDDDRGQIDYDHNDDSMNFVVNAIDSVHIDSGGQVGINETAPSARLDVFGNTGEVTASFHRNTSTDTLEVIEVTSNVTAGSGGTGANGENRHLEIQTDGDIINTNNSYTGYSDLRLKEDVEPIADGALSNLLDLNVVEYRMRGAEKRNVGLIGQEVKERFPLLTGERDGYITLKSSWLPPVIIKAMQEQQKLIDELRSRLTALETN